MIVRSDLPLGFMAAQIVHAAGESITGPLPPGTNAVVLEAISQEHLKLVSKSLQLAGIPHVSITEIDEPWTNQLTAIGIVPLDDRRKVRKILSELKLLGKNFNTPGENENSPVQNQPGTMLLPIGGV